MYVMTCIYRVGFYKLGNVVWNKARLVAKSYDQEDGIDYNKTFTPLVRLEAIRLLIAYARFMNFNVFQMDFKSTFLNGFIKEEVYVEQPPGFEVFDKIDHSIGTPMSPSTKLDKDDKGKNVDQKLYRGMIGSLLYLIASRLDILFNVCLCATFQSCSK
ncbi:Uncharacterized protein TCM_013597 [Theobroma cacao]|uniref:Reverse transcriptase Ty1/copia-type domain-containing protein n=1 Tax=Theobroma cacao TaxID=3641 RepID=A0A061FXP7_THECC|nr:Uncharacterized protein TCM_013597 [Theobroma cacao]